MTGTAYQKEIEALKASIITDENFDQTRARHSTSPRSIQTDLTKFTLLQTQIVASLASDITPDALAVVIARLIAPDAVQQLEGGDTTITDAFNNSSKQLQYTLDAVIVQIVKEAAAAKKPVMEFHVGSGKRAALPLLIDALIALVLQLQNCPLIASIPGHCIEVVAETSTAMDCEGVFAYLNSRITDFKSRQLSQRSHLTLLRTCNLLLKRLSKSQNAMLCGRILLFLAKFLPLTEGSGLNKIGHYDEDNTTPIEDIGPDTLDSEGNPVDAAFYETFWSLQKYFSHPPTALAAGKWQLVSKSISSVLDKFKGQKVTVTESVPKGIRDGQQGSTVKYLSSSRLLSLQIQDATLRRHVLVQCLILLQYCEEVLQKEVDAALALAKEKETTTQKPSKAPSKPQPPPAKKKDLDEVRALQTRVYRSLEHTPECGPKFAAAIKHLMIMESFWCDWKVHSCPVDKLQLKPLVPPPAAATEDIGAAGRPKKRKRDPNAVYGVDMGTEELTRLWNVTEDNTSTLSADDRGGFKTLRQLMDPVISELNEPADDDFKIPLNQGYIWKTLRVVARHNLKAFADSVKRGMNLDVAARVLYPDEVPPEPEPPAKTEAEPTKDETTQQPTAAGEDKAAANGGNEEPQAAITPNVAPAAGEDEDMVAVEGEDEELAVGAEQDDQEKNAEEEDDEEHLAGNTPEQQHEDDENAMDVDAGAAPHGGEGEGAEEHEGEDANGDHDEQVKSGDDEEDEDQQQQGSEGSDDSGDSSDEEGEIAPEEEVFDEEF